MAISRPVTPRCGIALASLLLVALPVRGTGSSLFLECPCRITGNGETLTVSAGVRSFRSTDSGPVRMVVEVREDGVRLGRIVAETSPVDAVPAGSLSPSGTYTTTLDPDLAAEGSIGLVLQERRGDDTWHHQDRVRLDGRVDLGAEFDVTELDYLADGDGDGVSDANEILEGTDPVDDTSMPGASTIDLLALYSPGFADLYEGDATTRISSSHFGD